jgi:hypothetical protein
MATCFRLTFFIFLVFVTHATTAQYNSTPVFRLGGAIAFGLSHMAANNIGIGGMAGAEKSFSKSFAAELETSYTYFTGDKAFYMDGRNKAFTAPLLAGIKAYPFRNVYGSLRTGAMYYLLNSMPSARISLGYGAAAGINLPRSNNRLNLQISYTGFRFEGISRGYTTLAAAIIIR